jgi:hypothetical protein
VRTRSLRKLVVDDNDALNRIQEYIQYAMGPILGCPITDGAEVTATLSAGTNTIDHKLGRKPRGYLVGAKNANVNVWGTTMSKTSLTLEASGTVTLTLWVY